MGCAMVRPVIAGLSLCLLASAALAEDVTVTVSARDCARLLRHQPAADVAFKPGEGVKGKRVAPADLPGSGGTLNVLPEVFEIPITINPVGWAERNAATKKKAAAESGIVANTAAKKTAQSQLSALVTEKSTLDTRATTLTSELGTLTADQTTLSNNLAALDAQVTAGTISKYDVSYAEARRALAAKTKQVTAKQSEITANTAAITTNTTARAVQQAIIDAAPANEAAYTNDRIAAESTLSTLSSRGLDDVSMKVGTVRYDTVRGLFTYNDQPLGTEEAQVMAEACAKRGVK